MNYLEMNNKSTQPSVEQWVRASKSASVSCEFEPHQSR